MQVQVKREDSYLCTKSPFAATNSIKRDYCHSNDPGYCPIGCTHCYGVDDGSAGCVLLNGLADATNLELIADLKVFILRRDLRWCPTFTKLKTLLLIQWVESAEYCALICILQHSPFLEKLTLQLSKKPDINVRSRAIYNSMGKSFASENLKTVEVKCQDIDQKVHKLIISLNNYRIPLEKINIQQTNESYELPTIITVESRHMSQPLSYP